MERTDSTLFRALLVTLVLLLSALALTRPAAAEGSTREEPAAVPAAVREAMMAGKYEEALRQIEALEAKQPEQADFWNWMRALAFSRGGQLEQAAASLDGFAKRHPESVWRHKANFELAEVFRRLRKYQQAEAIYEAAVGELRAEGRQRELAEIYLGFANELSTPPEEPQAQVKVDYARAFSLYEKMLDLDLPRDLRDHAMFRKAHCKQQLSDWGGAIGLYTEYLKEFDPFREGSAAEREGAGAKIFEARYALGECRVQSGDLAGARRTFIDLVALLGPLDWNQYADLSGDAAYAAATTWIHSSANETTLGIAALRRFLDRHPDHRKSAPAAFDIAEAYRRLGRFEDALEAYEDYLARRAPATDDDEVREEAMRLAQRALFAKGEILAAQKRYDEAIGAFTQYTTRHTTGPDWASAQRGILEAEYNQGTALRADEQWAGAREVWTRFLEAHPLDGRARQILFDIGELYYQEAEQDGEGNEQAIGRYHDAIAHWKKLPAKYPGTEEASQALYRIGLTLETKLRDLPAAIEAYRACNFGSHAGWAVSRLTVMTEPSLAVRTERTWRGQEAAQVLAQVRNVKELEVAIYNLDLEAYFRKHLTHRSIEELDLDLIAPDRTITIPVEEYENYKPIEQHIALPVEGPGVWAIALTADEKRATTLVIRSDIEVILKSSRSEVFVFAEDLPAEKPAEGVTVLVGLPATEAGAAPTFQELVTDSEGIARLSFPELETTSALRVFASRDGHCASNGLSLDGLGLSAELEARGFVYTDRTAYRPGDAVHWRAILRTPEDGRFSFERNKVYQYEIVSQDRSFQKGEVQLGRFGTVSGDVVLDEFAPLGTYTVRLRDAEGRVFQGFFEVQQYRLKTVELDFEFDRDVYYRGEPVKVTVSAAYYYGEPVTDSPLQYSLPDGRTLRTRTDDEGRAEFVFETRDMPQEGLLSFRAALTEEQVMTDGQVYLAWRGYQATLAVDRELHLAGDRFHVDIATTTPGGEATSQAMKLQVLKRESKGDGTWAEVLHSEEEITTTEETGRASTALQLDEGGWYTLRVEGLDRFENPVTASGAVFISGEEDQTRLRILADARTVQVGEQLTLDVHNRAGAGLALITLESENVLEYRVMHVDAGHNRIALTVDHQHFPNFVAAAALMRGNEFFTANSEFLVERALRVTLKPRKESYAPGEEAVVDLEVTDQLGRPVSAELALAVVDEALYEMWPEHLPKLVEFFQPPRRDWAALNTVTSCTFSYQGSTQEIAVEILDELARQEAEGLWANRRVQTLAALEQVDSARVAYLGVELLQDRGTSWQLDFDLEEESETYNDMIGLGGGAGGSFGGRFRSKSKGGWGSFADDLPSVDADAAFWAPAITTDEEGRAIVRFRVPDRSTRWRLSCRGVDRATSVGEGDSHFVSRSDFFVELRVPQVVTEGDRLRVTARVHNLGADGGEIELQSSFRGAGLDGSQTARVRLGDESVVEHTFELSPPVGAEGPLEVELVAEGSLGGARQRAMSSETLTVRPWGIEYVDSASGRLSSETALELELPVDGDVSGRLLEIYVGSGVERVLVDAVLGRTPWRIAEKRLGFHADAASELLGVCAVLEGFQRAGRADDPERQELDGRAAGLVARLLAAQRGDGGWSWSATEANAHPETSCRALVALMRAGKLDLFVPPASVENARNYLTGVFRQASHQADELKAMIVHALACAGQDDFSTANRLHRVRPSLSPAALAYTARALAEMGRAPMALEVAEILEQRVQQNDRGCRWPVQKNLHWNRSSQGMTALAVLALIEAKPASEWIAPAVESLLARAPWHPAGARGLVISAVARAEGEWRVASDRMRVTVRANGETLGSLELNGADRGQTLRLALEDGPNRPVKLEFVLEGLGKPHWSAVLRGFSREVKPRKEREFLIRKTEYLATAPIHRGRTIPTGFGVTSGLSSRDQWKNEVEHVEPGELFRGLVEWIYDSSVTPEEDPGDYLTLEIPLPAGTRVLEGSVSGSFRSYESLPGELQVLIGQQRGFGSVTFTLIGADSGLYRALPVSLRSVYEPRRFALGEPMALTVLDPDATNPDTYRPTPDELFHLGKALYNDGDSEAAHRRLGQLYGEFRDRLREAPLRETAEMMLFLSIDRDDSAEIVRYFEVLKEKNPDLYVSFEKVLAVGRAYRELGEFERALLIFKATIEETFGKDLKVAGTLEEQDEIVGSFDTLERLWLEYPDTPAVRSTYLTLADKLLTRAPNAHLDEGLRAAGRDRAYLSLQGILALQRFLGFYPEDPQAPDAALNLVSAHLSLENFERVSELSGQMAKLYTKPQYADAFEYSRAVAQWYQGLDDPARVLLGRIAEATYTDEEGLTRRSENRDLALYILAQIHHARREFTQAADYYEKVAQVFSDAREVLEEFREKKIAMPEVTTARVGETSKLELTHRNLSSAELLVYPVDLLTLYLREKNLSNITQVNLAGISPTLRRTVELELGQDIRPTETEIELELGEAGAYLVICRGEELHTSGLVLVTDVELEVKEDRLSGRLRVTALDQEDGTYLRDVEVRVVGSQTNDVVRGKTDPRGLFIADGIGGVATVIARRDGGQYAFYRGQLALGMTPMQQGQQGLQSDLPAAGQVDQQEYFKNVRSLNDNNILQRGALLDKEIKRERKGVQVKQVK